MAKIQNGAVILQEDMIVIADNSNIKEYCDEKKKIGELEIDGELYILYPYNQANNKKFDYIENYKLMNNEQLNEKTWKDAQENINNVISDAIAKIKKNYIDVAPILFDPQTSQDFLKNYDADKQENIAYYLPSTSNQKPYFWIRFIYDLLPWMKVKENAFLLPALNVFFLKLNRWASIGYLNTELKKLLNETIVTLLFLINFRFMCFYERYNFYKFYSAQLSKTISDLKLDIKSTKVYQDGKNNNLFVYIVNSDINLKDLDWGDMQIKQDIELEEESEKSNPEESEFNPTQFGGPEESALEEEEELFGKLE